MAKLQRYHSDDRITSFPVPLLHYILSFLPTKDVVQSCLLSKGWTHMWSSIPFLNFQHDLREYNETAIEDVGIIKFIDSVFHQRDGSDIESLLLHLSCQEKKSDSVDITKVNSWITLALRLNVRVLDIELYKPEEFTPYLFTSASLRVLKLNCSYGELRMPNDISLPRLKLLSLTWITFTDEKISALLSSCPNLNTLIIDHCKFHNRSLTISCSQLETLILDGQFRFITISTPCLTSLVMNIRKLCSIYIDECPLVNANITIEASSSELVKQFIGALNVVQFLELSEDCIWAYVSEVEDEQDINDWLRRPFDNLKFLKLGTFFTNGEVQVINDFMRFSPNIQTLVLKNEAEEDCETEPMKDLLFECELSNLTEVKFKNFQGIQNEVKLVEFFVKKAMNLKKLTITASDHLGDSEREELLVDIGDILLKCPRVSELRTGASSTENISLSCVFV